MNEILINFIVQAILGGASGYITNDYAINMLFKEYTPLKLGGVIKKTRNEFIENLSSMIENDIINKEKLQEILNSDEFKGRFDKLTGDFYENCLYEAVGKDKFSDIDGFDSTIDGTDEYVQKVHHENPGSLVDLITDNFNAGIFLTRVQAEYMAEGIYASLKETVLNTDILTNAVKNLYENNKEIKLSDIFPSNMSLVDNLSNKAVEIAAGKADPEIFSGFDAAINEALNVFYNKKLKDIVKIDKKTLSSVFSRMKDQNTGYKLYRSLLSYGRSLDKSLYSIMDPNFEIILKNYVNDNLPIISELLVSYVQKNNALIDMIIEDSIDQVLNEADGIRAKLLKTFKNSYYNDLSKKYRLVDKIIAYIRQFTGSEKLSMQISKSIIKGLDTITISEIIRSAEENLSIDRGYEIFAGYISKNENFIIESIDNYISRLKVKDILPRFDFTAEKILSSETVKEFLKNKSRNYLGSVLTKELNKFIDEEDSDLYAKKVAEYLKAKYCSKENAVKSFISEKLMGFEPDRDQLKSKELTEFIYKSSYDKFKNQAFKLKDLNLSLALNKLNSIENIAENSSETIRKFSINNADVILKGSIKRIVSDNLNKLSDDELISLANDFIGRELRPIMFFGGVLGIIAGLILAAFKSSPLNHSEISLASMATYAFVGFITNVIAINMIFKPYREIKVLSRIPFLRNFSLGYIIKNQKNFAKSTAHYIDTSLLSKKSINELFEKYKDRIKESFIKSIAENNYSILSSLLIKNKEGTVRGIFNFLKGTIFKNLKAISSYLYEIITGTNISSVLNNNNLGKLSSLLCRSIKTDNISKGLNSILKPEIELKTIVSTGFINELLDNKIEKSYDAVVNSIKPDKLATQVLSYNDKYIEKINKSLGEVLDKNDIYRFSERINQAVFSQAFKNNASSGVISIFNRLFDRDKSFGELFDGKLKASVDNKLPQILNLAVQKIKDSLVESKSAVSTSLRAEFKANLGFIESGLYSLMDGDKLIDELVDKIMTEKLPVFMDVKKDEIYDIMYAFIKNRFYYAKVDVLYTGLNKLQINEVVERYLATNRERLQYRINTLLLDFFDKNKDKNLTGILDIFNLKNLESIIKSYESEINAFSNTLYLNLRDNRNETIKGISSFAKSAAEELMNLKFSHVFYNLTSDDICEIARNLSDIFNKDDGIKIIFESFIKEYRDYNNNINLDYIVDKDEFRSSVELFIENLVTNDEIEKDLKQILYTLLDQALECNFDFIDSRSKEYVVNIFVEASIEALKKNLDDILKTVEFDRIAQEEIENMEPEKIHLMFNSFAGKYFRALMIYGIGGFVFGINLYVGFALTGLKILSEIFKKKDSSNVKDETKGRS